MSLRKNKPPISPPYRSLEKLVRVGCPAHDCGGRCLLVAHIQDGVITRLDTDDRPDNLAMPQLRACARGRSYLRRQYHPDRLLYPLKRAGQRGEGKFTRISWDEALGTIAAQIQRVKELYGNDALFVPQGTGSQNQVNASQVARRLLNLCGGSLQYHGTYSCGASNAATYYMYGTLESGNQRQDWLNSRYILMWGWNPAEMRNGTNSDYFLKQVRKNGARVVCIDPRHSMSAACMADEWIPIRPGTDAAFLSAMAYVIITEKRYDDDFIRTHCSGFDPSQMPLGLENQESYSDYILGKRDGNPKTPIWAEKITQVPASTIARIAREYASIKPGMLYQGWGLQRRAYGESAVSAACALAAITGNIGIPGGFASGKGDVSGDQGPIWSVFPIGENPGKAFIPAFSWTEAIMRGTEMTAEKDGILGADRLESNIKLIMGVATNLLINQHSNINRTASILQDEGLVEFISIQDNFLTSSARFADIVLPVCTQFETWGLHDGWMYGDELILLPKLVEPPGECKSDYAICSELADRLGCGDEFRDGRDERGWVEWCYDRQRERRFPNAPSLDTLIASNQGVVSRQVTQPIVAFTDFRRDPVAYPLKTPSGKIELFSKTLFDLHNPEIPAVPKYIQEWESPFGPEAHKYPLQAIGHHSMHGVHSTHQNNDWLKEAMPQRVYINPLDAQTRGIINGDSVLVFNDRGRISLPCRVTTRIMPGVVNIPEGAWWSPDKDGIDRGGCINVLTSSRPTPMAFATTQNTIMVEVEKE
jgi:anaerobic dimethyl sulfoxide reductase subunit A